MKQRFALQGTALLAMFATVVGNAQDFADTPIGLIVTEAKLSEYGRGRVVGVFPKASISRDPVRRAKGTFLFDTDEQKFERAQIPMTVGFSRGAAKFNEGEKKLEKVADATYTYAVATDAFLAKLRTMLAENKERIADNLAPTTPFENLQGFTETKSRLWYLRSKKKGAEEFDDQDVALSVAIDLGDRKYIEELNTLWTKDPKAGALAIYGHHYADQGVTISVYRLRPGAKATKMRGVTGIHFVRHQDAKAAGGRIVVPRGADEEASTWAVEKLTFGKDNVAFEAKASMVLENLVAKAIQGDGKEVPKLSCVEPDENEKSPCAKGKDGEYRIEGTVTALSPLRFVIEKEPAMGADPDAARALFRVELHLGATEPVEETPKK